MATPPINAKNAPNIRSPARNTEPFGGATTMAVLSIVFTLIGFWRSFFAMLDEQSTVHMWHGATSTGWLIFVLIQASSIRRRNFKLHRPLGWASVLLFTAPIGSSWVVLAIMLSGQSGVPYEFSKLFALSDATLVPLMIVSYVGPSSTAKIGTSTPGRFA